MTPATTADLHILELARQRLARAIAVLGAVMDNEAASPETRRKAASAILRLCERLDRRAEPAPPPRPAKAAQPSTSLAESPAPAPSREATDEPHAPSAPPMNRRQRRAAARIQANEQKRAARRSTIGTG